MKKLYILGFLCLISTSCMEVPTGTTPSDPLTCDFATVWEEFESSYPEFSLKGVNWELMYGKYLPFAESAVTDEELMMNAVFPMLAELEDRHLLMKNPAGEYLSTYSPDITPNYGFGVLNINYLLLNQWHDVNRGVGYCNPELFPYLMIMSWVPDLNMESIDEFVSLCQDIPAVIIDVRMNGGGTNAQTGDVVGRFTNESVPGWTQRFRIGPDYDDFEHYTIYNEPEGLLQYSGTVILLIGQASASTTEEFVGRMSELPNVITIGGTTLGTHVCSTWLDFTSGWSVKCGIWSGRTANGGPVEGCGIEPDIFVEATQEDFDNGIDPIMVYAVDLMNELNQ